LGEENLKEKEKKIQRPEAGVCLEEGKCGEAE
jgi:hypothetical protein